MEVAMPDDEDVRAEASFLKALADPARVRIIYALAAGELCVCELMELLNMPQTMVSHHCKILKYAQIVSDRKAGKWVYYSLVDSRGRAVLDTLRVEG